MAEESVCIAEWPIRVELYDELSIEANKTIAQWQEKIAAIRNLRAERNVPPSAKVMPIIVASGQVAEMLREGEAVIKSMTNSSSVEIVENTDRPAESASLVLTDAEVILPLAGLIDKKEELAKLKKQFADLEKQLGAIRAKLGNEGFISRAPADVVEAQKAKEAELTAQQDAIAALLRSAEATA